MIAEKFRKKYLEEETAPPVAKKMKGENV